jgi:hypothetical protein
VGFKSTVFATNSKTFSHASTAHYAITMVVLLFPNSRILHLGLFPTHHLPQQSINLLFEWIILMGIIRVVVLTF